MSEEDELLAFDVELTEREAFCIGKIIALWAALEHEIFTQTLETFLLEQGEVDKLPKKMNGVQFTETLELWRTRVIGTAEGKRREVLKRQYNVICQCHQYRNALVHGMWEWPVQDPGLLVSVRVNKRDLIKVAFTPDDLEHFHLTLQKINIRIRAPGGIPDMLGKVAQRGFRRSRRSIALFSDHPIANELIPSSKSARPHPDETNEPIDDSGYFPPLADDRRNRDRD